MANAIVVPLLTPTGSVHFTSISHDATIEDTLSSLAVEPRSDILSDLHDHGWHLQMVRKQKQGRLWNESELESLGDGLVSRDTKVASLFEASPTAVSSERHFSAFPLTSYIHQPKLRLVSQHSLLSIYFTFFRVPEIHDGFRWRYFLARTTTVSDALKDIIEELGLTKSTPLSGDAIDYEIEEVWIDGEHHDASRLPGNAVLSQVLENAKSPFSPFAQRHFHFVVPDEWYRRSKPGSNTVGSTVKAISSIGNEGEDNTAKQLKRQLPSESTVGSYATATQKLNSTWKGTFSSSRLSSIFDSWLGPNDSSKLQTNSATIQEVRSENIPRRISVSGPILVNSDVESSTASSLVNNEHGSSNLNANDISVEFEMMINELGLKGPQKKAMQNLPVNRKLYLLNQNRQMHSSLSPKSPTNMSTSPGQIGSNSIEEPGMFQRFSVTNWTSGSQSATTSNESSYRQATGSMDDNSRRRSILLSNESNEEPLSPVRTQNTGGLWNGWWAFSSVDKVSSVEEKSPKWYIDGVRNFKTSDPMLTKHLISMRVHLSTAKMPWIEMFLNHYHGMEALNIVLENINEKRGKGKHLTDSEETTLLEIIRCLRVLLNIEEGFKRVLIMPTLVTHIAYTLHSRSWKLRTLTSEVLAAICMLSLPQGHKLVLSAMSDYCIAFQEDFRFEELVNALRLPGEIDNSIGDTGYEDEGDGAWEAKAAILALINALTNGPQALEDRILLREEFSRRGLNEVIVTLRYTRPPDSIITQINVYTEEKFEDEEDMREHAHKLIGDKYLVNGEITELDQAMKLLSNICKEDEDLSNIIHSTMKNFSTVLNREHDLFYKINVVQMIARFIENVANSEEVSQNLKHNLGYSLTSPKFAMVQNMGEADISTFRGISPPGELKEMSSTINKLIDERTAFRREIDALSTEINGLRPVPAGLSVMAIRDSEPSQESTSKQSFQGLVQRLVQKEKQVSQLQKELQNLKLNKNVAENRDSDVRIKHARDIDRTKLANLTDEIVNLKVKISELHQEIKHKEKDIIYFKRALESVHSRSRLGFHMKDGTQSNFSEKLDADMLANQAISALTLKDKEIEDLNLETTKLREKLKVAQLRLMEKDFKNRVIPPPPPPPPPAPPPAPTPSLSPQLSRLSSSNEPRKTSDSDSTSDFFRSNPTSSLSEPSLSPISISRTSDSPLLERQQEVHFNAAILSSVPISPPAHPSNLPNSLPSHPSPVPPPPPIIQIAKIENPLPPPPPPVLKSKGISKPLRSSKQLKPFFWNKLPTAGLERTVWNDIVDLDILLNLKDIEEEFAIKNNSSQTSTPSIPSNRKAIVTTLLDITRANNVSIMLARIKHPPTAIKNAILEINDDKLSIDDLKAIARHLPTTEEQKRISEFVDIDQLAKADQYFNIIMSIPRLQNRLECMVFRRKLDLELDEIEPELEIVQAAAKDLRSSDRFKSVLQIVLRVGNTLNGSNFRGNARGFQLEALLKLKETKTVKGGKNCPTLLHYIARVLLRTDPSLLTFAEDFLHVEAAARVSVQNLFSSVNALASGLNQVQAEVDYARYSHADSCDHFVYIMEPFISNATPRIHQMQDRANGLEKDLKQLLFYYGETPESIDITKPEDFFGLVTSFSSSLRQAASDVREAETKISKFKQSPLELHERTSKASFGAGADKTFLMPTPTSEERLVSRGAVDEAIRSLRGGTRRTRPQRPVSKIFLDGG